MRSVDEVGKLTRKTSFLKTPKIFFLSEGYGNYNYLIQEGEKKYVLRLKKSDEVQFLDSLEREYVFLKYFRSEGINFCPEVYFYDHENNFLIEEFLEGEEVSQEDFSDKQIDVFARQLFQLFTLNVEKFPDFCLKNKCNVFHPVSPLSSLEKYGFNRFEEAIKCGLHGQVANWIEDRLQTNLNYLQTTNDELGFTWGDIQSKVIIGGEDRMYFYDFEHAAIANGLGLSYIKIHGKFTDSQFDYLLQRCALYFGKTISELTDEIKAEEKIIRTNDVIWAAMMWTKTGEVKFKSLMEERISLAEELD